MQSLWIGIAGFFGAICRYEVDGVVTRRVKGLFPWGTVVVNVSGCFLLGFLFALLTERWVPHPTVRAALMTGFVGAYTTFSTFAFETVKLGEDGALGLAVMNVLASVVVGVAAAWVGSAVGRAV